MQQGKLRTRVNNGREEFLVCAHVGTNTPDNALTPFAVPGPGGHPATIAPRVVIIDAGGTAKTYSLFGSGLSGSSLKRYAGSTSVHEGFVQMWIPFTPSLREPGFTVRVEIRGNTALPGGATQVMGADEVFVHLGQPPVSRNSTVDQAAGAAVDDAAIVERPSDPGADDVESILLPMLKAEIQPAINEMLPYEIASDWDWELSPGVLQNAPGSVNSAPFTGSLDMEIVDFNPSESRLQFHISGTAHPQLRLYPRSFGLVSFISGSCSVSASVNVDMSAAVTFDLSADGVRPVVNVHLLTASGNVTSLDANGTLLALGIIVPYPHDCEWLEGKIRSGMAEKIKELLSGVPHNVKFQEKIAKAINAELDPADLATGPLSSQDVPLPNGAGFGLSSSRYVRTAPDGHTGGQIWIHREGIDLAASMAVTDQGGSRFPYSARPSGWSSVVTQTHNRTRTNGQAFDVGLVLNGASVNQLLRALTAGKVGQNPSGQQAHIGILDVYEPGGAYEVHPSVAPLYLPTAPQAWPAPSNANLYVPSLRIQFPNGSSMASDLRLGVDAFTEQNKVQPYLTKADVKVRFLRVDMSKNQVTDPTTDPGTAYVVAAIRNLIPAKVAAGLGAINADQINDLLKDLGKPPLYLRNLSVGTVGGGHLGVYADLETTHASSPNPVSVTWNVPSPGGPPASVKLQVNPAAMPGIPPHTADWTVKDRFGAVVYKSPAGGEAALSRTISATKLPVLTDPCTGDNYSLLSYTVVITGGYSKTVNSGGQYTWAGSPPPEPLPPECYEEPEPPEPDPEDPPIPPICKAKPWLCEDL